MNFPSLLTRRLTLLACAGALTFLNSCQTAAPLPEAGTYQRQGQNALQVTMDKTVYRVGDLMTCTVISSVDCRLTLSIQRADGQRGVIYPNPLVAGGKVFPAGRTVRFPDSENYQFRVTGPTGREQLIVQASSAAAGASPPASEGQMNPWLKQVSVESAGRTSPASVSPAATGEARVVYEVIP